MSDYKQTRDAAGTVTSQYGQMLRNLDDDLVERLRSVSLDLGVPSTTTLDSKVVAQAADRIEKLEAVLREVDAWIEDLGPYTQEGHEPATVFKRVKEVLNK